MLRSEIMDTNYLEAVSIIENGRSKLEGVITKIKNKGFENEQSCIIIKSLFSAIEIAVDTSEYYSKPIKEGYLTKTSSGQFEIECINGTDNYPLCCGDYIEILINADGWKMGRVEHTLMHNKGYYFYNEELKYPELYSGMKTRIRLNQD